MLPEKRAQLLEIYQKWEKELEAISLSDRRQAYSHPYYLHIPDNWFIFRCRILIVGEEGYGESPCDISIGEAQAFNRDYLKSQLGLPNSANYRRSSSAFWRRIRAIAALLDGSGFSITWTNLDKLHRCGRGNCKLREADRIALHSTPTRILSQEIRILQPTHVIYFGWYGTSLERELPTVYEKLYPPRHEIDFMWKGGKIDPIWEGDVCHIFTYHPNWGQRIKNYTGNMGYEDYVLEKIRETIR